MPVQFLRTERGFQNRRLRSTPTITPLKLPIDPTGRKERKHSRQTLTLDVQRLDESATDRARFRISLAELASTAVMDAKVPTAEGL